MARLESVFDAIEPRSFVNLLRRHMIEIDRIVHDLERNMDGKLVRHYLSLFNQMFSGGYVMKEDDFAPLSNGELNGFGKVSKLMQEWEESVAKQRREKREDDKNANVDGGSSESAKSKIAEPTAFEEFFDGVDDPFEIVASLASIGKSNEENVNVTVGEGGIPLPPPPPPALLGPVQQKPPICPVNFEAISASEIGGTVWADMSVMNLKKEEMARLEKHLRILFGRDARDRPPIASDASHDGVLETSRLRNLEVLLFMEELKGLSTSEMIDLILAFDQRIFNPSVLERLVRKVSLGSSSSGVKGEVVSKSGSSSQQTYAFLPSQQESKLLLEYEKKHGTGDLRPGEMFFLELTRSVPDRLQRFEFGYFMSTMESEMPSMRSSLRTIERAEKAVRGSDKFRAALKIVLDVLTTLMPRYGLTRGFRISSFVSSVDRVTGSVQNPDTGEEKDEQQDAAEPVVDPSLPESKRKRLLKLALLRSRNPKASRGGANGGGLSETAEFWQVRLPEYITVYMNRFEVCQGFWNDVLDACDEAMRVDLAQLDAQTLRWMSQLEAMKVWFDGDDDHEGVQKSSSSGGDGGLDGIEGESSDVIKVPESSRNFARSLAKSSGDLFFLTVSKFMRSSAKELLKLRAEVLDSRSLTESLWKWMGEVMGSEPTMIFKYVHAFAESFQKQWKQVESHWDHKRTMVLRGALKMKAPPSRQISKVPMQNVEVNGASSGSSSNRRVMENSKKIASAVSSIEGGAVEDEVDKEEAAEDVPVVTPNETVEVGDEGIAEGEEELPAVESTRRTTTETTKKPTTNKESGIKPPKKPKKKKREEKEHEKEEKMMKKKKVKKGQKTDALPTPSTTSTTASTPLSSSSPLPPQQLHSLPEQAPSSSSSLPSPPDLPPKPAALQSPPRIPQPVHRNASLYSGKDNVHRHGETATRVPVASPSSPPPALPPKPNNPHPRQGRRLPILIASSSSSSWSATTSPAAAAVTFSSPDSSAPLHADPNQQPQQQRRQQTQPQQEIYELPPPVPKKPSPLKRKKSKTSSSAKATTKQQKAASSSAFYPNRS